MASISQAVLTLISSGHPTLVDRLLGRARMKVYAGTTEQFRADARMHRIAEKLRTEYTTKIGHRPAPSEVACWQNSLMALSMLVDQAQLNDHGVILAYQLGNTSRRRPRC